MVIRMVHVGAFVCKGFTVIKTPGLIHLSQSILPGVWISKLNKFCEKASLFFFITAPFVHIKALKEAFFI